MKTILFSLLFLTASCATKYIIPGNRFITPETQGGAFKGQFDVTKNSATQATIDASNGTVDNGVDYINVSKFGFLFANSFFDNFDLLWSHTGNGNSLFGPKLQILGDSKMANSDGVKFSLAALFGGNEYETDSKSIDFELTGKEYLALLGYRIGSFLPYTSFSVAKFNFEGTMKPSGLEPSYVSKTQSLSGGLEFDYPPFVLKLEATYQQLATTDTNDRYNFLYGYSVGFAW